MLMAEMNHVIAEMEAISGVYGFPRYQIPEPAPVHTGPSTYNNIRVGGHNFGVINAGEIRQLDLAIDRIRSTRGPDFSAALGNFAQAVLDNKELSPEQKQQLLEQVNLVASEAAKPPATQKRGIVRPILTALKELAHTVGPLAEAWKAIEPYIHTLMK